MDQTRTREHAIVIGGSIAGLFTATVLAKHFRKVTLIERDPVADSPEARKGQPHARHLHGVLAPARLFVRERLPGVEQALVAGGAVVGDWGELASWFHFDGYKVRGKIGVEAMSLSRPFLEWHVRRGVTALPNVTLRAGAGVKALTCDDRRTRVTGVRIGTRDDDAAAELIEADLVVDASGRGSRSPRWLGELGFEEPAVDEVVIRIGYATREYRRDARHGQVPPLVLVAGTFPLDKRGAYLFPVEGDRWIVTAGGWHDDHPPSDEAGFLAFLRGLRRPDVYDVVANAEPLSEITLHKFPASRRVRYERLKRFPGGYLVLGDAVASMNPIYGQGMSSAAMQAQVLDELLGGARGPVPWRAYFKRAAAMIDRPWQLAVGEDFRFPETKGTPPPAIHLLNRYVTRVHHAVQTDPVVYRRFLDVMHLVAPPTALMTPAMLWRVLRAPRPRPALPAPSSA